LEVRPVGHHRPIGPGADRLRLVDAVEFLCAGEDLSGGPPLLHPGVDAVHRRLSLFWAETIPIRFFPADQHDVAHVLLLLRSPADAVRVHSTAMTNRRRRNRHEQTTWLAKSGIAPSAGLLHPR